MMMLYCTLTVMCCWDDQVSLTVRQYQPSDTTKYEHDDGTMYQQQHATAHHAPQQCRHRSGLSSISTVAAWSSHGQHQVSTRSAPSQHHSSRAQPYYMSST